MLTCLQGTWDPNLRWLGCWSTLLRTEAWCYHIAALACLVAVLTFMLADVRELMDPWSPAWSKIIAIVAIWHACLLRLLR